MTFNNYKIALCKSFITTFGLREKKQLFIRIHTNNLNKTRSLEFKQQKL